MSSDTVHYLIMGMGFGTALCVLLGKRWALIDDIRRWIWSYDTQTKRLLERVDEIGVRLELERQEYETRIADLEARLEMREKGGPYR